MATEKTITEKLNDGELKTEYKCPNCKAVSHIVDFDYDCKAIEVWRRGKKLGTIYPDGVDASDQCIEQLIGGSCPICDRWEDGMGNTCNSRGWGVPGE